jgi:hypothetical protein
MVPFGFKVCFQLLASIIALGCVRADSPQRPTSPVAARVYDTSGFNWRVVELPNNWLRLYIQKGTDADASSHAMIDSIVRAQADVLALLEEPTVATSSSQHAPAGPVPATLFILGSRADMQRVAGRPLAGFVQQTEATAFFVWTSGYRAPLRHELAHLYTFQRWGQPLSGAAATWLVEGIGAWAGGPCLGESPDGLAAGLLASGRLPSLTELSAHFRDLDEDVAMSTAGSLTGFLHGREGIAGLRARWQANRSGELLPDSAVEAAWRNQIAGTRPGTLNIARVVQEGC